MTEDGCEDYRAPIRRLLVPPRPTQSASHEVLVHRLADFP